MHYVYMIVWKRLVATIHFRAAPLLGAPPLIMTCLFSRRNPMGTKCRQSRIYLFATLHAFGSEGEVSFGNRLADVPHAFARHSLLGVCLPAVFPPRIRAGTLTTSAYLRHVPA